MKRTLVVGDCHFPFVDYDCLQAVYSACKIHRPQRVVQVGDLYDLFAWSKFPKSLVYTPQDEIYEGRKMAEAFWKNIQKQTPRGCEYHQILGNHDVRPTRRLIEAFPEGEVFFTGMDDFFKFQGVTSHLDSRKELILDNVCYIHGHLSRLGAHMRFNGMNTVHGHTHRGGIHYENFHGKILWELDAGFIADPKTKALSYTPQKFTKWIRGYGLIDENGNPHFIPTDSMKG